MRDRKGRSAHAYSEQLLGATLRFDPCETTADSERLGGLPPYAGSECEARLSIKSPDLEHAVYAFRAVAPEDVQSITKHFADWAKSVGANHLFQSSGNRFFPADRGDRKWDLWIRQGQHVQTKIYIPASGFTPQPKKNPDKSDELEMQNKTSEIVKPAR